MAGLHCRITDRDPYSPRCLSRHLTSSAPWMCCARGTTSGLGFVTRDHWLGADCGLRSAEGQATMSIDSDMTGAAAEAAAAPLDLLLTDAVFGALRRVNPGGSGVRLAAALATRPRLVAGRGGNRRLRWPASRWAARRFSRPGGITGSPTGLEGQSAAAPRHAGLPGDRTDGGGCRRGHGSGTGADAYGWVALRNLVDALAPSNNPVLNRQP